MARGASRKGNRTLTIGLDDELSAAVDRTMIAFGLESRSGTGAMILRSWLSAEPEKTWSHELGMQSVRELRRGEIEALYQYYSKRASLYKAVANDRSFELEEEFS